MNHADSPQLDQTNIRPLWEHYKRTRDQETKNQILLHYIHLVKQIVRRMMPRYNNYNEYDDLVNCGIIGLIDAVEKYDLKHGVKFETYAVSRIRGEILDYMREQDWAPSSLRKKINLIAEAYETFENQHGHPPSEQDVAGELGMTVTEVRKVLSKNHAFNLVYFEDNTAPGYALGDIAGHNDEQIPESSLVKDEVKRILIEVIDNLPEKERLVITLYYFEELMFKDIAEILNVSESRISQIHSKVLMKMRTKMQKVI